MLGALLLLVAGTLQLARGAPAGLPRLAAAPHAVAVPPALLVSGKTTPDRGRDRGPALLAPAPELDRGLALLAPAPELDRGPALLAQAPELDRGEGRLTQDRLSIPPPAQRPLRAIRRKREPSAPAGSNLSIVNPLQVLRRRLLLEIVRRRMRQKQTQINVNSEILHEIGKRDTLKMSEGGLQQRSTETKLRATVPSR